MFHACINLLIVSGFVATFSNSQPTAQEITERMHRQLDSVASLSADFIIASHFGVLEQSGESTGSLYLQRAKNQFRLEQEDQTVVSDGETVWTFIPSNKQIIVSPMEDSGGMRPDDFLFYYSRQYTSELLRTENTDGGLVYVLELTAADLSAQLDKVTIWVDSKKWLTIKAQYNDDMNSSTTIEFTDIQLNPSLVDSTFMMSIPNDVEVVDLR